MEMVCKKQEYESATNVRRPYGLDEGVLAFVRAGATLHGTLGQAREAQADWKPLVLLLPPQPLLLLAFLVMARLAKANWRLRACFG